MFDRRYIFGVLLCLVAVVWMLRDQLVCLPSRLVPSSDVLTQQRITSLEQQLQQANERMALQARRRAIEDHYTIRIVGAATPFQVSFGQTRGGAIDEGTFFAVLPQILDEIERYPEATLSRAGVEKITVSGGTLISCGREVGGEADLSDHILYVNGALGVGDVTWRRLSIHHEIFHFIDAAHFGGDFDPQWIALNASGFHYEGDARAAIAKNHYAVLSDRFPGFVSDYARTNPTEDKAECYAHLLVESAAVSALADKDPVLQSKLTLTRRRLEQLSPPLRESFWYGTHAPATRPS